MLIQNEIEVAKWETKKLWQGRVENIKGKLQEKEKTVLQQEKQVLMWLSFVLRVVFT